MADYRAKRPTILSGGRCRLLFWRGSDTTSGRWGGGLISACWRLIARGRVRSIAVIAERRSPLMTFLEPLRGLMCTGLFIDRHSLGSQNSTYLIMLRGIRIPTFSSRGFQPSSVTEYSSSRSPASEDANEFDPKKPATFS